MNTVDTWHQIVASKNIGRLDEILGDNVVFYSPVVHTPQVGKVITKQYLTAAFFVFFNETFKYINEVTNENSANLEFTVEIDGILVNGVDMIFWDTNGKITKFKVMIRPLKAINLIHQKMAAMLKAGS
tara:strand:- start:132469 stop:132852 length:384 start_codon:yes stop_codon:yes gene_type:complete